MVTNKDYKRFVRIRGEKPVLDNTKIADDALYDGVFVLTSNTKLSGSQLVERYKDLWQIEAGFRQLKSELEVGPMFHWKDRRIRAHIMICFLALILRTELNRRLKKHDSSLSFAEVKADLSALNAVCSEINGRALISRTELKDGAKIAFSAIGMRPPNRILTFEPVEGLLV